MAKVFRMRAQREFPTQECRGLITKVRLWQIPTTPFWHKVGKEEDGGRVDDRLRNIKPLLKLGNGGHLGVDSFSRVAAVVTESFLAPVLSNEVPRACRMSNTKLVNDMNKATTRNGFLGMRPCPSVGLRVKVFTGLPFTVAIGMVDRRST